MSKPKPAADKTEVRVNLDAARLAVSEAMGIPSETIDAPLRSSAIATRAREAYFFLLAEVAGLPYRTIAELALQQPVSIGTVSNATRTAREVASVEDEYRDQLSTAVSKMIWLRIERHGEVWSKRGRGNYNQKGA